MQIGMIGLGRMGGNMARRLMRAGHTCAVYDRNADSVAQLAREGAKATESLANLVSTLTTPRAVWIMVPAGAATEQTVESLGVLLEKGDIIIDGGNSFYKDDIRRAGALQKRGISYVDVGTSGGIWGLERGYCLMIGGEQGAVTSLDPVFGALAPGRGEISRTPGRSSTGTAELGYLHCGTVGSGHFVKMVHNGIEYGLMQAYAEGLDILRNAGNESLPESQRLSLNVGDITEVWRRGSVVSSWLLDLTATALVEDPTLEHFSGVVQDSGEGRWTIAAAIEQAVPAEVLAASLFARFRSRQQHTFAERVLSAMRHKFGGHIELPTGE